MAFQQRINEQNARITSLENIIDEQNVKFRSLSEYASACQRKAIYSIGYAEAADYSEKATVAFRQAEETSDVMCYAHNIRRLRTYVTKTDYNKWREGKIPTYEINLQHESLIIGIACSLKDYRLRTIFMETITDGNYLKSVQNTDEFIFSFRFGCFASFIEVSHTRTLCVLFIFFFHFLFSLSFFIFFFLVTK